MRKIGMMQPYLFPYLGYFQLIAAVDAFVLGDNLQYVKETWINRNRILEGGKAATITFPLKKSSYLSRINEKVFADSYMEDRAALRKRLHYCYANAPYSRPVLALMDELLRYPERQLAGFAINSIRRICDYLEIATPIMVASGLDIGPVVDKQERVAETMKRVDGDLYINPVGGMLLYDPSYFAERGFSLCFHRMHDIRYQQFGNPFEASLSIIDVLMFNSREEVRTMLDAYDLLDKTGRPFVMPVQYRAAG